MGCLKLTHLIDLDFNNIWKAEKWNKTIFCVIKQRIFDQARQAFFTCIEKIVNVNFTFIYF